MKKLCFGGMMLLAAACSRSHDDKNATAPSTPALREQAERQQQAIARSLEQRQKQNKPRSSPPIAQLADDVSPHAPTSPRPKNSYP